MLFLLLQATAGAGSETPSRGPADYSVKAALVLNFLKFVEWPARADSVTRVEIVADEEPRQHIVQLVSNGSSRAHPLRVSASATGPRTGDYDVLFIGAERDGDVARILESLRGRPVLTIGESDAFSRAGGMIRFRVVDRKVCFDVNKVRADEAGIRISSKLLRLAENVVVKGQDAN